MVDLLGTLPCVEGVSFLRFAFHNAPVRHACLPWGFVSVIRCSDRLRILVVGSLDVEAFVMVDLDCVRPLPGRALPITCFLFLLLFSSFLLIWRLDLAGCLIPTLILWDITYSGGEPAVFDISLFEVIL
jgi:hypothetical protein